MDSSAIGYQLNLNMQYLKHYDLNSNFIGVEPFSDLFAPPWYVEDKVSTIKKFEGLKAGFHKILIGVSPQHGDCYVVEGYLCNTEKGTFSILSKDEKFDVGNTPTFYQGRYFNCLYMSAYNFEHECTDRISDYCIMFIGEDKKEPINKKYSIEKTKSVNIKINVTCNS